MKIEGLQEVKKHLKRMPKDTMRIGVMVSILKNASKPLVKAAKNNLTQGKGVETGALKDSIGTYKLRVKNDIASIGVGPRVRGKFKKVAKYSVQTEWGAYDKSRGGFMYMTKAWQMTQGQVEDTIANGSLSVVEKYIKRKTKLGISTASRFGGV